MISKDLLDILVCPFCKSEVKPDGKGNVIKCQRPECALEYPVQNDIPIMLIDKAGRPCPKCGKQRDWNEETGVISCTECHSEIKYGFTVNGKI